MAGVACYASGRNVAWQAQAGAVQADMAWWQAVNARHHVCHRQAVYECKGTVCTGRHG